MALKQNGGEGQTTPSAVTGGGSATSGAAFTTSKGAGSPTMTWDASSAAHGTVGMSVTPVASAPAAVVFSGFNNQYMAARFYIYLPAIPTATATYMAIMNTSSTAVAKFSIGTTGRVLVNDSAGILFQSTGTSPVGTVLANTWYRVEMVVKTGIAGTGTLSFNMYALDSTTPLAGLSYSNTTTANLTSSFVGSVQFGKYDAGASIDVIRMDDFAMNDGATSEIGPYSTPSPPTAAFTPAVAGLTATFDASASTAAGGAAISSYAWSYGDGGTGTGVTSSHTYSASGTYTAQLTVTDSNAQQAVTTYVVQVAPSSGSVGVGIVALATGWSVVGTSSLTPQQILNGADGTKWLQSPVNPTAAQQPIPLIAPLAYVAGQSVRVVMTLDLAGGGTSGTVDVALKEGATTRATITGTIVPTSAAGSVTAQVVVVFTAAQCATVTDWSQATFVPSMTGS